MKPPCIPAPTTTRDGSHAYQYDAENRLTGVSGTGVSASYVYGPEGRRVEENVGGVIKQFVYGEGGQNLIVLDGSSNILQDEGIEWREASCRVGGRHRATLVNGTTPEWELSDWLGGITRMPRMAANASGGLVDSYTSWPYGANLDHVGIVSNFHFTDKYHDSETGLDYFGARYYASSLGRFLTPDWSKNPEGVPYADYANPQSLNLYSYVLNNPATATDPDGHWCFLGLFGSTCGQGNANSSDKEGTLNTTSRTPKKSLAVVASELASATIHQMWRNLTGADCTMANPCAGTVLPGGALEEGAADLLDEAANSGAQSPALQNFIHALFQKSDTIPGGTAGAVRQELLTGGKVGNKLHSIKAQEIVNGLNNLLKRGLSDNDAGIARALIRDLQDAIGGGSQ